MSVRQLRPAFIVPSDSTVWLIDESRPAAVALRGNDREVVHWQAQSPTLRALPVTGGGLVVQSPGSVTWVRPVPATVEVHDLCLSAADGERVWLVDNSMLDYTFPHDEPRTLRPDHGGRILALRLDGSRTEIATELPVRHVEVDGDSLVIDFSERPVPRPQGHGGHAVDYPTSRLRVPIDDALDVGRLSGIPVRTQPAADEESVSGADTLSNNRFGGKVYGAWMRGDPAAVVRFGLHMAGLVWWVGADPDGSRIDRHVLIRGHDPATGAVVTQVDVGRGLVRAARLVAGELWIAVARRRLLYISHDRGVEVVAVAPDGRVRTVLPADSVDISFTDPPLVPRPSAADLATAAEAVRDEFGDPERYWQSDEGKRTPLAAGLHDAHLDITGDWPETTVVLWFRHPSRPGLQLRRTFRVFDEAGRPVGPGYAAIHLMEDLDTRRLSPAAEAVDGILDT